MNTGWEVGLLRHSKQLSKRASNYVIFCTHFHLWLFDERPLLLRTMSIKDLRSIAPDILEDLIFYFKYASSAYTPFCPRPNGRNLVTEVRGLLLNIQGFIARDGDRKELVLALRGSVSIIDILVDSAIVLVPLITPGVEAPSELPLSLRQGFPSKVGRRCAGT